MKGEQEVSVALRQAYNDVILKMKNSPENLPIPKLDEPATFVSLVRFIPGWKSHSTQISLDLDYLVGFFLRGKCPSDAELRVYWEGLLPNFQSRAEQDKYRKIKTQGVRVYDLRSFAVAFHDFEVFLYPKYVLLGGWASREKWTSLQRVSSIFEEMCSPAPKCFETKIFKCCNSTCDYWNSNPAKWEKTYFSPHGTLNCRLVSQNVF